MANLADFYTKRLHDHFQTLYAVWTPGIPIAVGDVGSINNAVFRPKTSLSHFGISFGEKVDTQSVHYEFSSSDSTEIVTHLAGSGPVGGPVLVNGGLEVNFSSENSVFFNAAGCRHHILDDQIALGENVMKLYEKRQWDDDLAVVTEVIEAGATTVIASGGSNASVIFEATANVPTIDLADANLKFSIRKQKNVGLKVVSEAGLTPLIGLSKIQSKGILWGRRDDFDSLSMPSRGLARHHSSAIPNETPVRDAFYFGRV